VSRCPGALRYLVGQLDAGKMARSTPATRPSGAIPKPKRTWLSIHNEQLWRPLF
jgi:hypothetical protein